MRVNLSYALAELHEASNYIWENNPSVKNWPSGPTSVFDVMNGMRDMMKRDALKNAALILKEKKLGVSCDNNWVSYSGTGGYYFLYDLIYESEEEVVIGATILVDAALRNPDKGYVTEEVDDIAETV